MLKLDEDLFEANTIIDLVILPGMPVNAILSKLTENFRHLIILDTQGELYFEHRDASWSIGRNGDEDELFNSIQSTEIHSLAEGTLQKIDYSFISSLYALFDKLEELRKHKDFVLVIDSVTFVCDASPRSIRLFNRVLWSIIYECNATVITINHYRIGKAKRSFGLVPRMGKPWLCCISYQLMFKYTKGEIEFSVNSFPIENF